VSSQAVKRPRRPLEDHVLFDLTASLQTGEARRSTTIDSDRKLRTCPATFLGYSRQVGSSLEAQLRRIYKTTLNAWRISFRFALLQSPLYGKGGVRSVPIKGHGTITFRPGTADSEVLSSIFSGGQYDTRVFPQDLTIQRWYERILAGGLRPLIIDAGANIGAAAVWFGRRYPEALIVAVEPEPENSALCRRNVRPRDEVIQGAIGSNPGYVTLDTEGKATDAFRTRREEGGAVRVWWMDEIISSHPDCEPFIVKIDIEGFESDLFSDHTGWVERVKAFFIEPHDWMLPGQGTSTAFQRRLSQEELDLVLVGENLVFVRPHVT